MIKKIFYCFALSLTILSNALAAEDPCQDLLGKWQGTMFYEAYMDTLSGMTMTVTSENSYNMSTGEATIEIDHLFFRPNKIKYQGTCKGGELHFDRTFLGGMHVGFPAVNGKISDGHIYLNGSYHWPGGPIDKATIKLNKTK